MIEKVKRVIEMSNIQLSIKQISDLTGIPRTSVRRYCQQLGYVPSRHEVWNKGLTKETNNSLKQISNKLTGRKVGKRSDDIKKKISSTMKSNPLAGGYRDGSGRGRKHIYKETLLNTDYSLEIAKLMDLEEIKWERPKTSVYGHHFEFYLPEYNLYLVVKEIVPNDIRKKLIKIKNQGINLFIIDDFLYKRIKYVGLKLILKQILE